MKKIILTSMALIFCNHVFGQITLQLTPSDYNGYNISCFGFRDGGINLTVTGGTPPYTYIWSNEATTEDITDLAAGFYGVTVTDANNNSENGQITLTEPLAFGLRLDPSEYVLNGRTYNISCAICYDGSITSTLTEGIPPFTYLWDDNTTTQNRSGLYEGTYKLMATDDNGCTAHEEAYLDAPERTDWTMTGNTGSNPSTNFIGTSDNVDFVFRTNNVERLRIKSDGNLNISSFSGSGNRLLLSNNDGQMFSIPFKQPLIPCTGDPIIAFQQSQYDPADVFTCWRRVGIGTDFPQEKFEVKGMARFGAWNTSTSYVQIGHDGVDGQTGLGGNSEIFNSGNGDLLINYDTYNNPLINTQKNVLICTGNSGYVETGGYTYLATGAGKKVGIGNTNPGYTLDVTGDINATGDIKIAGNSITGGLWQTITGGGIYYNSGNVGIGTSTPSEKLDVAGNIKMYDKLYFDNWQLGATGQWPSNPGFSYDGNDETFGLSSNGGQISLQIDGGFRQQETGEVNYFMDKVGIGTTNPENRLQVGDGAGRIGFGSTPGTGEELDWAISYIGFNAHRDEISHTWTLNSDGIHNGGSAIWSNTAGDLNVTIKPSSQVSPENPQDHSDQAMEDDTRFRILNSDGGTKVRIQNGGSNESTLWTINGQFSYGFGTETVGGQTFGHIYKDVHSPSAVMTFNGEGKVGIGVSNSCNWDGDYKLFVKNGIRTEKVKVDVAATNGWADYVFNSEYKLISLKELEQYIKTNKHLPGVPTTEDVTRDGIDIGEIQAKLLEKVEELTLYLIQLNNEVNGLKNENKKLKAIISTKNK